MARLSSREILMLAALGCVVVLAASFVGWKITESKKLKLRAEIKSLQYDINSTDEWVSKADLWKQRAQWLKDSQPKAAGADDATPALLETIQASAKEKELQVLSQDLLPSKKNPTHLEVSVKVKVRSNVQPLMEWLYTLQSPEQFQVIPSFSLKTDNQATTITCDLVISRWYAPDFQKP